MGVSQLVTYLVFDVSQKTNHLGSCSEKNTHMYIVITKALQNRKGSINRHN